MNFKLYCMMVSGIRLSEVASEVLYQNAAYCIRKEIKEKKIVHDDIDGVILTEFETMIMGSVAGIVFKAEVNTPQGSTKVTYIVSENDIDDTSEYEWVQVGKKDRCPFSNN